MPTYVYTVVHAQCPQNESCQQKAMSCHSIARVLPRSCQVETCCNSTTLRSFKQSRCVFSAKIGPWISHRSDQTGAKSKSDSGWGLRRTHHEVTRRFCDSLAFESRSGSVSNSSALLKATAADNELRTGDTKQHTTHTSGRLCFSIVWILRFRRCAFRRSAS